MINVNFFHRLWFKKTLATAYYFRNRYSTKTLHGRTPYEMWHKKPRFFQFLCVWMRCIRGRLPSQKMAPGSWAGTLVKHNSDKNEWRIFDWKNTVFVKQNVIFNELNLIYKTKNISMKIFDLSKMNLLMRLIHLTNQWKW